MAALRRARARGRQREGGRDEEAGEEAAEQGEQKKHSWEARGELRRVVSKEGEGVHRTLVVLVVLGGGIHLPKAAYRRDANHIKDVYKKERGDGGGGGERQGSGERKACTALHMVGECVGGRGRRGREGVST